MQECDCGISAYDEKGEIVGTKVFFETTKKSASYLKEKLATSISSIRTILDTVQVGFGKLKVISRYSELMNLLDLIRSQGFASDDVHCPSKLT